MFYKRIYRWCGKMLLCALLAALCFHSVKDVSRYEDQEILYSVKDTFCPEDRRLELSTLLDSDIYYTVDGSTPSRDSLRYREPILLRAGRELDAVTIRAIAYYPDGRATDVYTRTYFKGIHAEEAFSTLIVSVSGDPENFYDYETGILVEGKLRDDYLKSNPDAEITDRTPANYNLKGMESEREAHVEIWEPDGTRVISQDMGVRVSGGSSRGSAVKSLRLIARKKYGENRLSYPLFPKETCDADNTSLTEYKTVVLRNHGNDHDRGFLRNELAQRLAADAGFPDTQACRPAVVYLNGSFYGFEWLELNYDDEYFHTHYGTEKGQGSWQVLTPHRGNAATASTDKTDIQAVMDLNELFSYQHKDLQDDTVFAEFSEKIDIENFLLYSAIEIYLSNTDWPNNNCKAYRWYSNNRDYSNPYADGKWRFLLYDLDVTMARTGSSHPSNLSLGESLGYMESPWDRTTPLLKALLQRDDMRIRFTEIMEELMEGAFSPAHALQVLEEMEAEMDPALNLHLWNLAETGNASGIFQEEALLDSLSIHREQIEKIREFFIYRPETMRRELAALPDYCCGTPGLQESSGNSREL